MRRLAAAGVTAVLWASLTITASAQYYGQGTVGGNGVVKLTRTANTMRMQVDVLSRGGDIREALDGLKKRTRAAREKLAELGARADSIKVEEPVLSTDENPQRQQMERMIAQSLRNAGRGKKKSTPVAKLVTVSARLSAEWTLDATDAGEQLVKAHELQQSVRDADLSGGKEASALTPEEQEILEESQDMISSYNNYGEEAAPGEPVFYFTAPISDADYQKALAEGFQKAKSEAALLAGATGSQLGKLESLTVSSHGQPTYNDGYSQSYRAYQALQRFGVLNEDESTPGATNQREAIGTQPGVVTYNLTVTAGFGIQ